MENDQPMNCASATHVIYLPTGEVARIVAQPAAPATSLKVATLRCEFVDGRQVELRRTRCTVLVTAAEIAEYQRTRCLWQSLAHSNPPAADRAAGTG
jgi:hypothetical protein